MMLSIPMVLDVFSAPKEGGNANKQKETITKRLLTIEDHTIRFIGAREAVKRHRYPCRES